MLVLGSVDALQGTVPQHDIFIIFCSPLIEQTVFLTKTFMPKKKQKTNLTRQKWRFALRCLTGMSMVLSKWIIPLITYNPNISWLDKSHKWVINHIPVVGGSPGC